MLRIKIPRSVFVTLPSIIFKDFLISTLLNQTSTVLCSGCIQMLGKIDLDTDTNIFYCEKTSYF